MPKANGPPLPHNYQWHNLSSLVCNKNLQLFWFWMLPVLHQGGQNRLSFLSPQKGHSRKYNGWIATKTQTHYRNNHWIIINKHCRNKNEIKIDLLQYASYLVLHAVLQEIGINHILYLCKIRSNLKLKNLPFETDITKKRYLNSEESFFGKNWILACMNYDWAIAPSKVLENKWKLIFKYYRSILNFSSNIQIWIFVRHYDFRASVAGWHQEARHVAKQQMSLTVLQKKHFTSKH